MKNFQVTPAVLTGLKSCAKIATSTGTTTLSHAQLLNETAKALGFESYRALQASSNSADEFEDLFLKDSASFTLAVPQYFTGDDGEDFIAVLPVDKVLVSKIAQMARTASLIESDIEMRVADLPARKGGDVTLQVDSSWIDFESIKCHKYDTEVFISHCPICMDDFKSICRAVNTGQTRHVPEGFCLLKDKESGAWLIVVLCDERGLSSPDDLAQMGFELSGFEVLVDG